MTNRRFAIQTTVRLDDETRQLLNQLAELRKANINTVVRQLIIEEARRQNVTAG